MVGFMKQMDKDRFHSKSMTSKYDRMCRIVPGYDFMQQTIIDMIKFNTQEKLVLLDLGAGSGIFIDKILKEFPDSVCYYLDYSDEFTSLARQKLQKYPDRVTYIHQILWVTGNHPLKKPQT